MKHKKNTIILLLLLITVLTSNAQQWCEKGAKWHSRYGSFARDGYRESIYTNDTTIAGQQCHIISSHTKYVDQSIPKLFYGPVTESYSYASNGIIYELNDSGRWDTLYNFHLLPGDSTPFFYRSYKPFYVHINDTGHRIVNGYNLQWYSFTYMNYNQLQTDTVFERIGYAGPRSLISPCINISDCDESGICNYYDSAFGNLYNNANTCLFVPNGIIDVDYIRFSVFPNPSSAVFTLTSSKNLTQNQTIYLYNSLCKLVRTFPYIQAPQQAFDLSLYSQGIYWLVVGDEVVKLAKE